jgi:hypothetical protein
VPEEGSCGGGGKQYEQWKWAGGEWNRLSIVAFGGLLSLPVYLLLPL